MHRNNKRNHLQLQKCIMVITSAVWQQAAYTTCRLSSSYSKRDYLLTKQVEFSGEKNTGEWTISGKSKKTRQKKKNERGDRKGELNDSPEIPDWM